jgi:hypothetical protein
VDRAARLGSDADDLLPPAGRRGAYAHVRILVRLGGRPLGFVERPLHEASDERELLEAMASELASEIDEARAAAAAAPPRPAASGPLVTVLICTRERPEALARSLATALAQTYAPMEVLIVDNAPASDATRQLVESVADDRVRYLREERPGLSRARNTGVRNAHGAIVAFTDDDVLLDPDWLA